MQPEFPKQSYFASNKSDSTQNARFRGRSHFVRTPEPSLSSTVGLSVGKYCGVSYIVLKKPGTANSIDFLP